MNQAALDRGISDIHEVSVPAAWADLPADVPQTQDDLPDFIKKIIVPCNAQKGDDVPVSEFLPYADGSFPVGSTQYEKTRHCRQRSQMGCHKMRTVQSLFSCLPSCLHPPISD